MKINKLKPLLIFTCLLYSIFSFSQNLTEESKLLSKILVEIEKEYEVTFTYANKVIETIKITPPLKKITLPEIIEYLKEKTGLVFTFSTSTNILISKKSGIEIICGYLVDFNSNQYLKGAHISVLKSNIHTTSNSVGYFSIPKISENQVIQISYIGYPTLSLNSTDFLTNKCLTITLTEKFEELSEVILQNYLTSGITIKTDNSFVISPQEFGILPGLVEPDVLHQIQALPGISSVDETVSDINIRGGTNDQNLLLWDGIKMYHSGHFFGLISAFNPYLTESVTVIKNGTDSQYNDGVSGTISIESIDEIKEKPFGGAGINLLSADAYGQIPISKKLAIQVSGRRAFTDLWNSLTFEQYFNRAFQNSKVSAYSNADNEQVESGSNFYFYDYSIKLLYNINEKHQFRFSFLDVKNELDYKEAIDLEKEADEEYKESSLEQKNKGFGFQLTDNWNSKFKTVFNAYYTKYNLNSSNQELFTEQLLQQRNEVLETGLKLNTHYSISKKIQLLNGYHYYELGITNTEVVNVPDYSRIIKNVLRNHSLFSEVNYTSSDKETFVNAGLRLNYIENFNTFIIEPRLQALHKLNKHFSFKIAGEFKSQNATQIIDLQEDFLGVEKRRWILADNTTTPIIKSQQASAGFNFHKQHIFIDIEGFYKYVDGITTANQGFQNQNQYIKTSGSYTVKGIEFLINRKTDTFSTWLGYTYNHNTYNFPELTPSEFPNNLDIRHSISFGNTYTYKKFNFAIGLLWRNGKPYTTPQEANPITVDGINSYINYNSPNSDNLPNYYRVDFSSTYKFNLNKKVDAMAGISILNILNTKNILNTYYKITPESTINTINSVALATTPNFTFRISF
ncbi:MAG: carboxypeptidase-like regulatory domain-containing protein [Lutibacter sp.]|nr:carboxypeptidase-like regulatory domain-containing protein [Lutibacter sp.]